MATPKTGKEQEGELPPPCKNHDKRVYNFSELSPPWDGCAEFHAKDSEYFVQFIHNIWSSSHLVGCGKTFANIDKPYHIMISYDNLTFGSAAKTSGGEDGIIPSDARLKVSDRPQFKRSAAGAAIQETGCENRVAIDDVPGGECARKHMMIDGGHHCEGVVEDEQCCERRLCKHPRRLTIQCKLTPTVSLLLWSKIPSSRFKITLYGSGDNRKMVMSEDTENAWLRDIRTDREKIQKIERKYKYHHKHAKVLRTGQGELVSPSYTNLPSLQASL
ncbi:hypothetical protein P154DRAFT_608684 [Amniculicola lignicola CBS 123094]|uniref:Uncharacterized protein n=1 Tax=Amniculicola lignicola CBS 123094 TaxID=1392246 RepID=A0A6A5X1L4_9PLEO|nr:hypothetical protein P154DRAFT_608684 [Amniculicola lignicola CBS 123094]